MTTYRTDLEGITPEHLRGFFAGWPDPPSPRAHLDILRRSTHIVIAWERGRVIGWVNAISDGVLCAYIPLLEVRADRRGSGVGSELVTRLLAQTAHLYMVDAVCDENVRPFYETLGFTALRGMARRNREAIGRLS